MTIRAENLTKRYRQGEKEVVALLSFTYAFPRGPRRWWAPREAARPPS